MDVDTAWKALGENAKRLKDARIEALVAADPARAHEFALRLGPLYANFARQRYDRRRAPRCSHWPGSGVASACARRSTASGEPRRPPGAAYRAARRCRQRLGGGGRARAGAGGATAHVAARRGCATRRRYRRGQCRHRWLRPRPAPGRRCAARRPKAAASASISSTTSTPADAPADRRRSIRRAPRSCGVQELRHAGNLAQRRALAPWLATTRVCYAVSAHAQAAAECGVAPERILPMWDWVGGRYSLWSTVGFVVALAMER